MNTTPTPETDAAAGFIIESTPVHPQDFEYDSDGNYVPADFARRLERERDEARRELESLCRDKARLDWIFAVLNVVGTRGFSERVSWRYPGITREDVDAAMKEGTSCVSTATV